MKDISMLLNISNFIRLKQKINDYVHTKAINNLRRGIYSKPDYNKEELACKIYVPAYISLEYVLNKSGIIFQYNEQITVVSYLSRNIIVDKHKLVFRKIKNQILLNTLGILRGKEGINIATPERAFLDTLYLNKNFYFDNISLLNKEIIQKLLPIYNSKQLNMRVNKILKNA
ncbi:MAG: hypothetical protein WC223_02335 [Bacteroidales bacterium]